MAWPETVRKDDLEITYYRGSGPGGQHRNKTDSACRMKHKPTGIVTQSEEHKRQGLNRKAAFKRLAAQLVPLMREAACRQVALEKIRERIRTYHEPDQRVKDHRSGKTYPYAKTLDGDLDRIISDVQHSPAEEEKSDG